MTSGIWYLNLTPSHICFLKREGTLIKTQGCSNPELYIVQKVQIKVSSLRWSGKKVQIKVHAWTWTWAFILSSHKLTVLNAHQWSDVSLRSKLKFKFRHELWSEHFFKAHAKTWSYLRTQDQVWPAIQLCPQLKNVVLSKLSNCGPR